MRAPPGLTAEARRAWHAAVATLELQGVDPAEHAEPLKLYARAAGRLDELDQAWRDAGAELDDVGSRGQRVVDPLLLEIRALEEHVAALGDRVFGAAPARAGGWPLGKPRARDRGGAGQADRRKVVALRIPEGVRRAMGDDA